MEKIAIEIKDLNKKFGNTLAVKNMSFKINKGQTILADDANLFYGFATRDSVSGTGEYQMQTGNNVTVNTWTKTENAAAASSQSLANMIRIYRVDFDGSQTTRIGMDQIMDISSDLSQLTMPTSYGYYINGLYLNLFPIPTKIASIKACNKISPSECASKPSSSKPPVS